MRYFIDTEFIERGHKHPIELISIGVAAEDGREFYAVNRDFNPKHANAWVRENVLPLLPERNPMEAMAWMPYEQIRRRLYEFVTVTNNVPEPPQFWGYYCAFDYVVLSQLMGGMEHWPGTWGLPIMYDLRQELNSRGREHVRQPGSDPHNALQDARWVRETFLALQEMRPDV